MAIQKQKIAPEYLSFYIAGSRDVEIPLRIDRPGVVAGPDCINVPCLYWNDGDTTISLGLASDFEMATDPAFDGLLNTPTGKVLLFDANMPEIMSLSVGTDKTRVQIWVNHPTEPDEVIIAVG